MSRGCAARRYRQESPVNLSRSGYDDLLPRFTRDGKAVIWQLRNTDCAHLTGTRRSWTHRSLSDVTGHSAFLAGLEGMAVPASVEKEAFEPRRWSLTALLKAYPDIGKSGVRRFDPDKHSVVFVMLEETGHSIGYRFDFGPSRSNSCSTNR